ncbi:putative drug resistance transporter [Gordonia hirsuta DSM 44140 = NBRC 16056]|uniref:Putative drug resistance transporter n=1 Tax=Gordonia hirsuta DSM 44140 = NBRC 16056 TaxID=1121927 RepID=L7L876_9ACTN|nr:MDR family MFS transporter [Gordonia hirsuta]GAC57114.1 putative drug resistance transporter [Gordonia hirsuta DSM 44140 = NBRC 16056]
MTQTGTAATPVETKSDHSILYLFIGLMIAMLLAALNQTVLSTALPTIVGELDGVDQMTWVITAYILASTVVMPVYGRISDLLGRRPILMVAIVLFIAGSVVGALAGNIEVLIAARVLQGLGGGGLMILSQAAIADVVPARERGRYMGAMGAVFAVASVAGPLLGGWLTEGPGWRWAFWMNVPLGLLALVACFVFLKLPKPDLVERPRLDYLGMALIGAATTTLVLVSTWGGNTYAWASPQIIGLIAATVVLAVAFCLAELRAEYPVIPMALFRDRNFTLTTIASLAIGIAMFGALGYMPTYIQMVTGVSATVAGLLMIPMMGGLLVASVVSGRLVSSTGHYKGFPIAGSIVLGIGLGLLSTLQVESPTWLMCTYLAIIGIGIGLALQILTLIVQNSFPGRIVGTATAASNYFRQVGATLGSAVVGSIFASRLITILAEKLADSPLAQQASGGGGDEFRQHLTPAGVNALPEAIRQPIIHSYNEALLPIFLFLVPIAAIALIALLFVEQKPLSTSVQDEITAESLAEGQLLEMVDDDPRSTVTHHTPRSTEESLAQPGAPEPEKAERS